MKARPAVSVSPAQAAAFRLVRNHLAGGPAASIVSVCRDSAGMQAQIMSAAEQAFWTRRRETTRAEIRAALWDRRDLVRTSCMRLTLHVIPAGDFSLYITAVKPGSMAILQRVLTRLGARPAHVTAMGDTLMDALGDGPKTQQDLLARARAKAPRGLRVWLDNAWGGLRPAIVEGLICHGPPRGAEATFVRVDQWLPRQPRLDLDEARAALLERFLTAFGPATLRDFAKWSGMRVPEAAAAFERTKDDVVQVSVGGAPGWIRQADVPALVKSTIDKRAPRLLPAFDPLLLAHAAKDHLVEPRFYKRVYRAQGWISPVVLVGGRIVGVWFLEQRSKGVRLDVQPFSALDKRTRSGIEKEAEALGGFLGARCEVRFSAV